MICDDCHACGHIHNFSAPQLRYSTCPNCNGCRGRDVLAGLDTEIQETREKLNLLMVDHQKAKTELNSHHSSTIVKNMPTEIISTIFEDCVASSIDLESSETRFQADVLPVPLKLSQVCRTWRDIALSTGKIWTTMFISLSLCLDPERLTLLLDWLDRTKDFPIDIWICFEEQTFFGYLETHSYDHNPQYTYVVDVLSSSSNRWRNAYIQLPNELLGPLWDILRDMPKIDHLYLERLLWRRASPGHQSIPLQANFRTSPKRITLVGLELPMHPISIQWDSVTTAHIKQLTADSCLNLFESAPMLQTAILDSIKYSDEGAFVHPFASEDSVIQHTAVRHLSYSPVTDPKILFHLKCPNLTSLELTGIGPDLGGSQALSSFLTHAGRTLERLELVDFTLSNSDLFRGLHFAPSIRHLRLVLVSYEANQTPGAFLRYLVDTAYIHTTSDDGIPVFLPSLTTFEYIIDNADFPWQLVPAIFGPPEDLKDPSPYRRPLVRFKVVDPQEKYRWDGYDSDDNSDSVEKQSRFIPSETLLKLLTLRQYGAEISYETAKGEDMFKQSMEAAGILNDSI